MRVLHAALFPALAAVQIACAADAPSRPDLGGAPKSPARPVVLEPTEPPLPPPKEIVHIDPEAEATLKQNIEQPTKLLEPGTPPKVTALALEHTALSEARSLAKESVVVATLEEGRRAILPLPLAAADCVTVIAHGGLGVAEVDVFLVAPEPRPFRMLAQDVRTGQLGIIGGQRGCFVALGEPLPAAELWVQVRSGSGPVVVGVYRAPRP